MKKLFCTFFGFLIFWPVIPVHAALRSMDSITVEAGRIKETGVMADENGSIFIEFLKNDRVSSINKDIKVYTGEILPPTIISPPSKPPRARMRAITSFEIITNTGDDIRLIDQYAAMNSHIRERVSYKSERDIDARKSGAQFLTKISQKDEIGHPVLWSYNKTKNEWHRLGGILTESAEPDIKIFSAIVFESGTYTLWDENPSPAFSPNFPIDEIEKVEESPYPSVEPEVVDDGTEIPSVDEDFSYDTNLATNEENSAQTVDTSENLVIPSIDGNLTYNSQTGETEATDVFGNPIPKTKNKADDSYKTGYGIKDKISTEKEGFNTYDNFYNTFETYLGEDQQKNAVPAQNGAENSKEPGKTSDLHEAAPFLQTNLFGSTLTKSGPEEGFKIPWVILIVIGGIMGSIYIALQKKY